MDSSEMMIDDVRNPNVSYASKYQDLDALVQRFFADGDISNVELKTLGRLDSLLTREFRVAQDYIGKMDKNSPMYAAAQELLTYMYRCRNLIDAAHDKAQVYHTLNEETHKPVVPAPQPTKEEKEVLPIRNISRAGTLLMMSLMTEKQRMAAEQSFSEKEVAALLPQEREEIRLNVVRAITAIHDKQADSRRLNHILGLEHTRGSAR